MIHIFWYGFYSRMPSDFHDVVCKKYLDYLKILNFDFNTAWYFKK